MTLTRVALASVLITSCNSADARTDVVSDPQSVSVTSSAELQRIGDELSRGGSTGHSFLTQPGVQVVESRRVSNGSPEVHDDWMDATLVQAGRATLRSGGVVTGAQLSSPGEHRGGTITGAADRPLAPGDFVLVPPGLPHQFLLARGDSIRYLTIKVPRPRP